MRGDPELQSQSQALSSCNSLLSLSYVAFMLFFFLPCLNHTVRAGLWDLLVTAVSLPSQLPYQHHFVYCIINIKLFLIFFNLILYACLMLWILVVETNPGLQRPVPAVCRILLMSAKNISHGIHANSDSDRCSGNKIFVSSISVIHNICARFP